MATALSALSADAFPTAEAPIRNGRIAGFCRALVVGIEIMHFRVACCSHVGSMRADVIIVGSGPAAVSAAWPLVEAGCAVTMLDAAERAVPDPPLADIGGFRNQRGGWRHAFGDDFAGLRLAPDRSPKFATRIGQFVVASDFEFPPIRAVNFVPVRSFTAGGLSKIWGAFATAFDAADLRDYPFDKAILLNRIRPSRRGSVSPAATTISVPFMGMDYRSNHPVAFSHRSGCH